MTNRTSIVQLYIERPLLISGRKFDIRAFALVTQTNRAIKGYFYRDCYFRTSSRPFDLHNFDKFIHLTNDAVQVNSDDYGKYENANKMSIHDFQRFLDEKHEDKQVNFMRDLFPRMERLVTDTIRATYDLLDPKRKQNSFEIFGYDFMIDEFFKVYLIEVNTNPNIEVCCPLLSRIMPELLENTFRIAVDPLYQPLQLQAGLQDANKMRKKLEFVSPLKFTLVFDERTDGEANAKQSNAELLKEIAEEEQILRTQQEDVPEVKKATRVVVKKHKHAQKSVS